MTKQEKIQEYERKKLIEELSKMPSMVIATAYLYALNYTLYGEDVTEKWQTATQNASALEKAYNEGYHDAMEKEPKTGHWIGHREHCENLGVMPSGLGAYEWCSNCDCGIDVREWHRNNYN